MHLKCGFFKSDAWSFSYHDRTSQSVRSFEFNSTSYRDARIGYAHYIKKKEVLIYTKVMEHSKRTLRKKCHSDVTFPPL